MTRDPLDDELADLIAAEERRRQIDDAAEQVIRLADSWRWRLVAAVVYLVLPGALLVAFVAALDELARRVGW